MGFHNRFKRNLNLLRSISDMLTYALLKTLNYLLKLITALFSTFGLHKVLEDVGPFAIEKQQQGDIDNLRSEVHSSITFFKTEQRYLFNQIVDAIALGETSQRSDSTLPSTSASPRQSQLPLHHTSTSPLHPIPSYSLSLSFPSIFFSDSPVPFRCSRCTTQHVRYESYPRLFSNTTTRKSLPLLCQKLEANFFVADDLLILPSKFQFCVVIPATAISQPKFSGHQTFKMPARSLRTKCL